MYDVLKQKRRGGKIKKECTLRKETEMQRRSNETAGFANIKKYKKRLPMRNTNVKKDTETGTERSRKARGYKEFWEMEMRAQEKWKGLKGSVFFGVRQTFLRNYINDINVFYRDKYWNSCCDIWLR